MVLADMCSFDGSLSLILVGEFTDDRLIHSDFHSEQNFFSGISQLSSWVFLILILFMGVAFPFCEYFFVMKWEMRLENSHPHPSLISSPEQWYK